MFEWIQEIFLGLVAGMMIASAGYLKTNAEEFNFKKWLQTVVIGAIIGAVAKATKASFAQTETWLKSIGAITLIEYIKKIIWRKWLKNVFGGEKA